MVIGMIAWYCALGVEPEVVREMVLAGWNLLRNMCRNVVNYIEFLEEERSHNEFDWDWEIVALINVMMMRGELWEVI
jgi:hypothetical protein